MASAAVAFTVEPFPSRDDSTQLNLRLENKRADTSNGNWQHVREELVALKNVNIVSQLNRTQYAYRLSLRPTIPDAQQSVAFPFYLDAPELPPSPSSSEDGDLCPPEIGTFAIVVDQLQCQPEEQVPDSTSSEVAAMFGGTLAAALLVYSLLPYVRARNKKRRRSRSRTSSEMSNGDQQDVPTTPMTPNGASRRMWGSLDDDGIEPAGAHRDGLRERKSRQLEANGSSASDSGSELLLAKLPDFNDERGWRDFFDSQIYHNEHQEKRAAAKAFANIKSRSEVTPRETVTSTRTKILRYTKTMTTSASISRSDRYRTIRDRIDRAAMEAAIDEAHTFNEFWQM